MINSKTSQKFSFRVDIINSSNKDVYIGGRGSETVGSTSMDNAALPYLYYWKFASNYDGNDWTNSVSRTQASSIKELKIAKNCVLSFLLVFDGTNYRAYQLNTDIYPSLA